MGHIEWGGGTFKRRPSGPELVGAFAHVRGHPQVPTYIGTSASLEGGTPAARARAAEGISLEAERFERVEAERRNFGGVVGVVFPKADSAIGTSVALPRPVEAEIWARVCFPWAGQDAVELTLAKRRFALTARTAGGGGRWDAGNFQVWHWVRAGRAALPAGTHELALDPRRPRWVMTYDPRPELPEAPCSLWADFYQDIVADGDYLFVGDYGETQCLDIARAASPRWADACHVGFQWSVGRKRGCHPFVPALTGLMVLRAPSSSQAPLGKVEAKARL